MTGDIPPKVKTTRKERREAYRAAQAAEQLVAWARVNSPSIPQDAPGKSGGPSVPSVSGQEPPKEDRHQEEEHNRSQEENKQGGVSRGGLFVPGGPGGPGRPSEYTDKEGDSICAWVAAGGSLSAYCREEGRAIDTVYRWMRESASFHERYARAHEDRSDTLVDEMLTIADDAAESASIEGVAAAKLRVETRKWIAAKLRPQKYGDKQIIEQTGSVSIRIGIPAKATPVPLAQQVVEEARLITTGR